MQNTENTVYPEILAGIKFGGWAPNRHCKNIGGFKFGAEFGKGSPYAYMQARVYNREGGFYYNILLMQV